MSYSPETTSLTWRVQALCINVASFVPPRPFVSLSHLWVRFFAQTSGPHSFCDIALSWKQYRILYISSTLGWKQTIQWVCRAITCIYKTTKLSLLHDMNTIWRWIPYEDQRNMSIMWWTEGLQKDKYLQIYTKETFLLF